MREIKFRAHHKEKGLFEADGFKICTLKNDINRSQLNGKYILFKNAF
jgi:hypothetical protein